MPLVSQGSFSLYRAREAIQKSRLNHMHLNTLLGIHFLITAS